MAKSSPKLLDVDPETGRIFDEEDIKPETLEADQDKQFDDIVNEFEAADDNVTYRASINRVPDGYKKGGKEEWCFDVDSAEISGVRLKMRDEYGPGIYRVRVFKNKKLARQFDYHIAKPSISRPVSVSPDNAAVQALAEQIRTLNDNQAKLMERLLAGPIQNNQPDPFLMMERMSTIMKNMQPAHSDTPRDNSFTIKDGMDMFTKGMEIASDMRGDGGDTWMSVFKEIAKQLPVGDLLQKITEVQQQRRALPHPPTPNGFGGLTPQQPNRQSYEAPPRGEVGNATAPNSPSANGEQLQQSMRYLIGRAQRNSDPGLYAEWLLDNAPRQLIQQMVNDPNVLAQLGTIFPALNQPLINNWFAELVEATKEALAQNPETGDIPGGIAPQQANGNASHGGGGDAQHPGWGPGDQDHPENHASPGETGTA